MKKLFISIFCLALCARLSAANIDLVYDGTIVQKAELRSFGRATYIPLRSAAVLFKGKTQWFPIAGKVVLQMNNQKITFTVDSSIALIQDKKVTMDGPCKLVKDIAYVPLTFFLTGAFRDISGNKITWDSASSTLNVEPYTTLFSPRVYEKGNLTRIVFESQEEMTCAVTMKGKTLLVEIPKAMVAGDEEIKVEDNIVQSIQIKRIHRGADIKVLLTEKTTDYRHFQEKNPNRLVLEIIDPTPKLTAKTVAQEVKEAVQIAEAAATAPAPVLPDKPALRVPEPAASSAKEKEKDPKPVPAASIKVDSKVKKIVVDAGHGGKDTGAIGRLGTKEKDINLLIALELARILQIEGGYEVFLTRNDDTFISLHERTQMANEKEADLFISIHCNASVRRKEGGFEIYFLSENASDPHAEEAAELENAAAEHEHEHGRKGNVVNELLYEMAKNEFINESSLLCNAISKAVRSRIKIINRGTKQANFHVLHGAEMPAVLVETAFITFPDEEKKLRSKKFRSTMVDAILTGVENYQKQLEILQTRR